MSSSGYAGPLAISDISRIVSRRSRCQTGRRCGCESRRRFSNRNFRGPIFWPVIRMHLGHNCTCALHLFFLPLISYYSLPMFIVFVHYAVTFFFEVPLANHRNQTCPIPIHYHHHRHHHHHHFKQPNTHHRTNMS
jgi:hypothetical protein